jgi:hypothetical protein
LDRFRGERKLWFRDWKVIQTAARTRRTGSEPTSPALSLCPETVTHRSAARARAWATARPRRGRGS